MESAHVEPRSVHIRSVTSVPSLGSARVHSAANVPWLGTAAATLEVVVCRFAEDVGWLPVILNSSAWPSVRAVIVNHGAPLARDVLSPHIMEWRVANTGNECGCYLKVRKPPNPLATAPVG